jgi:hypothetical protein
MLAVATRQAQSPLLPQGAGGLHNSLQESEKFVSDPPTMLTLELSSPVKAASVSSKPQCNSYAASPAHRTPGGSRDSHDSNVLHGLDTAKDSHGTHVVITSPSKKSSAKALDTILISRAKTEIDLPSPSRAIGGAPRYLGDMVTVEGLSNKSYLKRSGSSDSVVNSAFDERERHVEQFKNTGSDSPMTLLSQTCPQDTRAESPGRQQGHQGYGLQQKADCDSQHIAARDSLIQEAEETAPRKSAGQRNSGKDSTQEGSRIDMSWAMELEESNIGRIQPYQADGAAKAAGWAANPRTAYTWHNEDISSFDNERLNDRVSTARGSDCFGKSMAESQGGPAARSDTLLDDGKLGANYRGILRYDEDGEDSSMSEYDHRATGHTRQVRTNESLMLRAEDKRGSSMTRGVALGGQLQMQSGATSMVKRIMKDESILAEVRALSS